MTPTMLKRDQASAEAMAKRVVKPETSEKMRYLFRLNVDEGTAGKADVIGYRVGGKTGTAEKVINGRYSGDHVLCSFIGAFPMDKPKYLLLVMLDEPQPLPETYGFRTSGWNATPTASAIIERVAPMLGVEPMLLREGHGKTRQARQGQEETGLMANTLATLIAKDAPLPKGAEQMRIAGLTSDSRSVKPGFLFAALPGLVAEGATFIPAALAAGAVAIVTSRATANRQSSLHCDGQSAPLVGIGRRALSCTPARYDRCRHRHQRQDLGCHLRSRNLDGHGLQGGKPWHGGCGFARGHHRTRAHNARSGSAAGNRR